MVSSHSTIIDKLLPLVKELLISEPVDVIENDGQAIYECFTWELVSPREDGLSKIGSANITTAQHMVIKALHDVRVVEPLQNARIVLNTILTKLEAERVIRRPPKETRKGFKIIKND